MRRIDPTDSNRIRLVENRQKRAEFLKAEQRFVERYIADLRVPREPDVTVEEAKRAFRKQRKRLNARVTRRCPTCAKRRNVARFWTRNLRQCDNCADKANRRARRRRKAVTTRSVDHLKALIQEHAARTGKGPPYVSNSGIALVAAELGAPRESESAPFSARQWRKVSTQAALSVFVERLYR